MYRILNELLQPYSLVFLISILAFANLWRQRRETRKRLLLLGIPLGGLLLLSMPAISHLAFGTLEWRFAPMTALPAGNQAIVVLGGGLLPKDEYRPTSLLGESTLYRCLHAAELYRGSGPCLVVLSGGAVRALQLERNDFEPRTWEAFWRAAVEGQRPDLIAADLGAMPAAVRKAKSRVLHRLREELGELLPAAPK
jgi:DNA-directed RNA polymerase specialized sigma24 family protein